MPSVSKSQERLMQAAAHTSGGYGGVPQSVGKEFVNADSKSQLRKDMEAYYASRSDAEFNEADHPRAEDGKFGSGGGKSLPKSEMGASLLNEPTSEITAERGKFSWQLKDRTGKIVAEYPASLPKKEAISAYENKIASEKSKKEAAKIRAKENKPKNEKIKENLAKLESVKKEHSKLIETAHHNKNLTFHSLPSEEFNAKDTISVYQSRSYGGKKGSEYRLIMVDGKPAYAREADHWGNFSTSDYVNGEQVSEDHDWKLEGIEQTKWGNKERHAGYVFLEDLEKMKRDEYRTDSDCRLDSDNDNAAGIAFRNKQEFLLVKSAKKGEWTFAGGHLKTGELPLEGAIRECVEELGSCPEGNRRLLSHITKDDGNGSYTTFLQDCEKFEVKLDHENTESGWFAMETLPPETHPRVREIITAISGNELHIAQGIQSGLLTSPQRYENIWLFDVRITGTGTSYRQALDEYVYRPPENFLTEEFVQRCNGLPLIFEHPKNTLLNQQEYRDRAIGNIVLPYIKGEDVWGIAKVLDDDAAIAMQSTHTSTSPAVVFRKVGSTETIGLDNGKHVFIEGNPSYLDHLAVCPMGVWDKGGEPTGINLTGDSIMAGENDVPAWADALVKRLDSMEEGMKADKARKDSEVEAEKEKEAKANADADKSEAELKADAEEKEALEKKERKDKARKDAEEKLDSALRANEELKAQLASINAQVTTMAKPLSASDRDLLSVAQSRADSLAQMFGDSVTAPLHGESPIDYRKRLAAKFQKHSKDFADVKLDSVDGATFDLVESRIYADAQAHAASPAVAAPGRLIPQVRRDSAGREITTYTGDMDAWMGSFKARGTSITKFNIPQNMH